MTHQDNHANIPTRALNKLLIIRNDFVVAAVNVQISSISICVGDEPAIEVRTYKLKLSSSKI
jgi:hypothetical protein